MRILSKYLIIQIPGWILLATVLYLLLTWNWISAAVAWGIFLLALLKDFILYPFLRKAYEPGGKRASENLIGSLGIARDSLNPSGFIRINGELWQAVAETDPIPSGTPVQVVSVEGFRLRVSRTTGTAD